MRRAVLILLMTLPLWMGGCKRDLPQAVAVYARGADSESLDPQAVDDGESAKVIQNLFEGLVGFGRGSTRIVPVLAESWTASEDGLEWTFALRRGVRFHDGTTFDADAVVFTFQRHLDEQGEHLPTKDPYRPFFADVIDSVTARDPHTVVFRLRRPYAPFLSNLAMFSAFIVSPTAVREAGGSTFGRQPVGTGPFRFVDWNHGEKKISLERNPDYWRQPSALDRLIFLTVPDNNARLSALRSGSCNWMDGLNPEDLEACRQDPELKVHSATGMNVAYLALNTQRPPFDDVRVRRAVSLAIDKYKLIDALYQGMAVPAVHPMPPGMLGYDDTVEYAGPDPARARALLTEAGLPDGFDTVLYCMPNPRPYYPNPQKIAQVFKSDLAGVGIRTTIDTVGDWVQYFEAIQNAKHPMCMLGWTTDNGDPDNFLYTFFSRESAEVGPGAQNMAFWVDEQMQELLRQGQSVTDPRKRAAIYRQALARVADQVPLVPIAHVEQVFVSRTGFEGFRVQPTGDVLMYPVRAVP